MKCCVVGGAGFIGSHLVDALLARGDQVVVIDNLSTGNEANLDRRALFEECDINDPMVADIFDDEQFDYVFHLAAQINLRHSLKHPAQDAEINILGSLNLLENCVRTKVKRVIFSSTGGAIYDPEVSLPWTETSPTNPQSPYGIAKLTVERYLDFFKRQYNLPSTILRYSNVYGPRQDAKGEAGVVAIFMERALKGEPLIIFGDGSQTRDFIYVDDVVQANLLAMDKGLDGIYNVSSDYQVSILDLAADLELTLRTKPIEFADPIPGEVLDTCLSADKLIAQGWSMRVMMDEGLAKTLEWFRSQRQL